MINETYHMYCNNIEFEAEINRKQDGNIYLFVLLACEITDLSDVLWRVYYYLGEY